MPVLQMCNCGVVAQHVLRVLTVHFHSVSALRYPVCTWEGAGQGWQITAPGVGTLVYTFSVLAKRVTK